MTTIGKRRLTAEVFVPPVIREEGMLYVTRTYCVSRGTSGFLLRTGNFRHGGLVSQPENGDTLTFRAFMDA